MSTVAEIEAAIKKLPTQKIWEVGDWFDEFREQLFNEQIDADTKAGRLDKTIAKTTADYRAGKAGLSREIPRVAGIPGLPRRIAAGNSKDRPQKFQTQAEESFVKITCVQKNQIRFVVGACRSRIPCAGNF